MNKQNWKKPGISRLNRDIKSANLQTNLVYETVKFTFNNTATLNGDDCTTYDGYMGTTSLPSGYATSVNIGTFHVGYANIGVVSGSIACS